MESRSVRNTGSRPLTLIKRKANNYQKYMDQMSEALNTNIDRNIAPYWRNHQSLKGKPTQLFKSRRLVLDELAFDPDQPSAQKTASCTAVRQIQ